MADFIPTNTEPLETWLVDSSGNIAVSGAGVTLLEAEMTTREDIPPNESRAAG